MPRRSKSNLGQPVERVPWSASEHLIVEAAIEPPHRRRGMRIAVSVAVLLVCAAVLVHLLSRSPEPALGFGGVAPTPAAWLHRYAHRRHLRLRLISLTRHGAADATLQVASGQGGMRIYLHRQDGLWRAAAIGN